MRNDFEERRQARIDSYERRAENARQESKQARQRSDDAVRGIPPGQPILVGHHSERRHRNALEKSHNAMRRSIELSQKAGYYNDRATAAAKNKAIFSDDPDASEKLAAKIDRLEARQELMKKANAAVRKNDNEKLKELGFSDASISQLYTPDFCGRTGFASYLLTNNNANIRRLKDRLKRQQKLDSMQTTESTIGEVRIVQNAEANRTQILFPGKPSDRLRAEMKRSGFRWAPSEGAWQKHLSDYAKRQAEEFAAKY